MATQGDVKTLRTRHQDLEAELEAEMHRPAPDSVRIKRLKKEKLRIKDEIARLER